MKRKQIQVLIVGFEELFSNSDHWGSPFLSAMIQIQILVFMDVLENRHREKKASHWLSPHEPEKDEWNWNSHVDWSYKATLNQ